MSSITLDPLMVFVLIVVIGIVLVIIFSMTPRSTPRIKSEVETHNPKENYKKGNGDDVFPIYNYLNKTIRLKAIWTNGDQSHEYLLAVIPPRSVKTFPLNEIQAYLTSGTKIDIYTFDRSKPGIPERYYSSYNMNVPEDTTIKMLHVGMITSRWVGADGDFNIGKPGMTAVQGMPWIKIHNYTNYPLAINENINISPGGILRYAGRDFYGVRLGTVFKDQDGIFPDYIFTIPATDVYYGVVSDIQQPLFGGFQLTPEFNEDPNEPQWLLEEGWMGGGETNPQIPYGYLPIEGPDVPPLDRWGLPVSDFNVKFPVGPPVELDSYMKS